jgi:hypothetical protein
MAVRIQVAHVAHVLATTESRLLAHALRELEPAASDLASQIETENAASPPGQPVEPTPDQLRQVYDAARALDRAAGPFENLTRMRLQLRDHFESGA